LLGFGKTAFLTGAVVNQPIHPLAGIAVFADRRVERGIAALTGDVVDRPPDERPKHDTIETILDWSRAPRSRFHH
jgi:hypothetical protein